jgi:hypothetical protein
MFRKLIVAETAVGCIGCAFLLFAATANQAWFDRHFLPTFFVSRSNYLEMYMRARVAIAVLGVIVVLLVRKPIARLIVDKPAVALGVVLAVAAGSTTSELILRQHHFRAAQETQASLEPRRHLDDRIGWLFDPSRVGYQESRKLGLTEYAFDSNGYRVRSLDNPIDFKSTTVIFSGESIMLGERLAWDDTIPAETARILVFRVRTSRCRVSHPIRPSCGCSRNFPDFSGRPR